MPLKKFGLEWLVGNISKKIKKKKRDRGREVFTKKVGEEKIEGDLKETMDKIIVPDFLAKKVQSLVIFFSLSKLPCSS